MTGGGDGHGGADLRQQGFPLRRETRAEQVPSAATLSPVKTASPDCRLERKKSGMPGGSLGAHRHPVGVPRSHACVHRPPYQALPLTSPDPSPVRHAPLAEHAPYPERSRTRCPREAAGTSAAETCPAAWPCERETPPHQPSSCSRGSCESLQGEVSPQACALAPPTSWRMGRQTSPPPDRPWLPAFLRRPLAGALIPGTVRCQTHRRSVPPQTLHRTARRSRASTSRSSHHGRSWLAPAPHQEGPSRGRPHRHRGSCPTPSSDG